MKIIYQKQTNTKQNKPIVKKNIKKKKNPYMNAPFINLT
jgi:hypothetical protein